LNRFLNLLDFAHSVFICKERAGNTVALTLLQYKQ
jgi:hypothetical protein